ncbi:MAG: hypothetical protein OXF79_20615 [Chloroflexi bacterium]|nr:hypothetical protein [Chloroflexota bacterium]
MSQFGADHDRISVEFLRRSREYLAQGELLQASEKGWGAAAHAAKSYAATRQLQYNHHEQLNDLITEMRLETHIDLVREWHINANKLHSNFYDDNLDALTIAIYLDDVAKIVNLIRQLTGQLPVDC